MSFKTRLAWQKRLPRCPESAALRLHDQGSLTARLQQRGHFSVHLLRQGLAQPTLDEAVALGVRRNRLLWVREVALCVDRRPLVFAHTALPYRPRGPLTGALARLGRQSLGALLFARPGFTRGAITGKRLDRRHALFAPAVAALQLTGRAPKTLWARRSCFRFGAQSVLVSEVFSPYFDAD